MACVEEKFHSLIQEGRLDAFLFDALGRPLRVGVIEVGSRAVRLLVADIGKGMLMKVLSSAAKDVYLSRVADSAVFPEKKLAELRETIDAFKARAEKRGAKQCVVFGTEAVRELALRHGEMLKNAFPEMIVLDKKGEAFCSLIAAAKGSQWVAPKGEEILIVDQGMGSMEFATGRRTGKGVFMHAYKSCPLGRQELLRRLRQAGTNIFSALRAFDRDPDFSMKIAGIETRVVFLGSAATKMGWLGARKEGFTLYRISRVHGRVVSLQEMDEVVRKAVRDPQSAKNTLGFARLSRDEFEQFVAGVAGIRALMRNIRKKRCVVSAWGTRYGCALLFAGALASCAPENGA